MNPLVLFPLLIVGCLGAPALPIATAVAPGYHVNGEVRQITNINSGLEVPAGALPYSVPFVGAPLTYASAPSGEAVPITYASVPSGETVNPEDYVKRIPVKALARPTIAYTPQITEVRPELKVYEKVYDVAVPKPVYRTQEITPVHHKYVPEPYAVPTPYAVPQPYGVPVPVAHPYHVQHHLTALPNLHPITYIAKDD